jgi:hypothetical protein
MKRLVLVALLVVACVAGGTARADGDPASDYLLGTQVFLPFDLKVSKSKQRELIALVHDVNASGYTIRVALIGSAYDMGAVTSLWRKPKPYATFLGAELQFVYKKRLLIVMPQGFGFSWAKHPSTREYAVLAKIPVGKGPEGLVAAAGTAVQRLAAASGVKVVRRTSATSSGGHSTAHDRAVIILGAVGAVAVAVLLRQALRRKRP